MRRISLVAGLALLLSACEFSLAGDLTPPPDALAFGQATPEPILAPAASPDLQAGAGLYMQSCAPCHGAGGLGDGEQAGQLPFAPAPLGDAGLARAASPAGWFRWVSEGRLPRYMPPFASVFTPQERWDVLAFAYSLSLEASDLRSGAALYLQYQDQVDELLDGDRLTAQISLIEALGLSEGEAGALTAYLQAQALGIEEEDLGLGDASPTPASMVDLPEFGSFTGNVLYGGDGVLPAELEATLAGYDHAEQVFSATMELGEDGRFLFEEVPLAPERIFFVQVSYQGQIYFSEFITARGDETNFEIPITVYETTTSTQQLAVESLQLFFDFSKPDVVRVAQQVFISNLGDRVVVPQADDFPVLHFSIPPNANNLAFQEGELGERYVVDATGFGDLRGVLPGANSYQLLFAYELPYTDSLSFQVQFDLPTRSLVAFLPKGEIKLLTEEFQQAGSETIDGVPYSVYASEPGYFPGDEVQLTLSGPHPFWGLRLDKLISDDSLLLGLAALTAAVGAAWLWVRSLPKANTEQILEEIAVLDERYERGGIPKAAYNKRRAALKARLRALLNKGKRK